MCLVGLLGWLSISACTNWQAKAETALAYTHEAGILARQIAQPILDAKCHHIAVECRSNENTECQALISCQEVRTEIGTVLQSLQYVVLDGRLALAIDDQPGVDSALAKSFQLANEIRGQLRALGVTQ